jgi:hypothetical protein
MKIEHIPKEILSAVRQRLGADDENDPSKDSIVEKMNAKQLLMEWSGWKLGDVYWARYIIEIYEQLNKIEHNVRE